ncbi:MAG: T9SS type A sorting domain-containing protein [Bacteroidota bacterium]
MFFRISTITLLCVCLHVVCLGQVHLQYYRESETKNFQEIVERVEAYYKDQDKGRGSGYKQFKRWKHYHSTRLSADGSVQDITKINFNEFYFHQENLPKKSFGRSSKDPNVVAGEWKALGPTEYSGMASGHNGGLGRVNVVEVDPTNSNILYVGTAGGGLWRSLDGGNSWTPLTDGIPRIGISGIAIDYSSPASNRTIYVLTGDGNGGHNSSVGVFKSMDNGRTWYSTELTGSRLIGAYKLKIHPTDPLILYVADVNGIFKTSDGGASWLNKTTDIIPGLAFFYDIEIQPGNPSRMYASTDKRIYFSQNAGESWVQSAFTPLDAPNRIELAVTPANPNYIYALCGGTWTATSNPSNGFSGIYRSTDAGLSFSLRSNSPDILSESRTGNGTRQQSRRNLAIAVSPTNANEVHVGSINCWKSLDGAQSWSNTSYWVETEAGAGNYTHADLLDLKFNTSSKLYCASDGGIFRSTDNAANWTDISEGLQITEVYDVSTGLSDSRNIVAYYGAQDNGLNLLENGVNRHWEGDDGVQAIRMDIQEFKGVLGLTQEARTLKYLFLSRSGKNKTSNNKNNTGKLGSFVSPMAVSTENSVSKNIYVGMQDLYRFRAYIVPAGPTNSRLLAFTNWTNLTNGSLGTNFIDHVAISRFNKDYIYVSKKINNKIYRSSDGGSSWVDISNGLPATSSKHHFAVHPFDPNIVYVVIGNVTAGQKVYKTQNGGTSWTNISGSLPNVPINCIVYDHNSPNGLYVGMDVGIFYKDDNLNDWIPFYNELPNVEIMDLEIDFHSNEIYAGTFGRGIWKSALYGKSCKSDVTISHDLEGFKYFTANNLTSNSLVENLSDVSFVAANNITLGDGFTVQSGADFIAKADPNICADGIVNAKYITQKQGIYAGPMPGIKQPTTEEVENIMEADINNLHIFPNPAVADIYLQLELATESRLSINLYDIAGNLIIQKNSEVKTPGKLVEKINVADIGAGTYIMEVNTNRQRISRKVLITK